MIDQCVWLHTRTTSFFWWAPQHSSHYFLNFMGMDIVRVQHKTLIPYTLWEFYTWLRTFQSTMCLNSGKHCHSLTLHPNCIFPVDAFWWCMNTFYVSTVEIDVPLHTCYLPNTSEGKWILKVAPCNNDFITFADPSISKKKKRYIWNKATAMRGVNYLIAIESEEVVWWLDQVALMQHH